MKRDSLLLNEYLVRPRSKLSTYVSRGLLHLTRLRTFQGSIMAPHGGKGNRIPGFGGRGLTYREIGSALGISKATIRKMLTAAGATRTPGRPRRTASW